MADRAWELILQARYGDAVDEFTRRIHESPRRASGYANRAIAYLQLRNYQAAAADYAEVLRLTPSSAGGHIGLGLCLWCQSEPQQAVDWWRRGVGAPYADAAGEVVSRALLLYAALRLRDTHLHREAITLLRKVQRRKQLVNWPGAVVPYLLGKFTEEQFLSAAHEPSLPPRLGERFECQARFYVGVRKLQESEVVSFRENMQECAQSPRGYLEDEYHLARWEVAAGFPELGTRSDVK